jgi:uncharacterized RmlC-like cupin family protein
VCGSTGLSLSYVVVPPGAVSEPHFHDGYETAIYQLAGRVETRYGAELELTVGGAHLVAIGAIGAAVAEEVEADDSPRAETRDESVVDA